MNEEIIIDLIDQENPILIEVAIDELEPIIIEVNSQENGVLDAPDNGAAYVRTSGQWRPLDNQVIDGGFMY